ncbi:MAG: flagellar basal body P-ring formation chaperone FlgA [Acidobacteriota bacterium]
MLKLFLVSIAASWLAIAADGVPSQKAAVVPNLLSSLPGVQTTLTAEMVLPAMHAAMGPLQAEIQVIEVSHFPVPEGEITFTLGDLIAPPTATGTSRWRGFVRAGGNRQFAIWAIVRVNAECRRVVATVALRTGQAIQAEQITEESYTGFPFKADASWTATQIIGRILLRSVRAGDPVSPPMVVEPMVVAKGTEVMVQFSAAGVVLKFPALAERAGRLGDIIPVRNVSSGKTIPAKVRSANLVVVESAR